MSLIKSTGGRRKWYWRGDKTSRHLVKKDMEHIYAAFVVICQSLQDSAIAEFIAKSSKRCNFRKNWQIFIIAAHFPQILGSDASCDVIAMRIQSKKSCFSVWKMEWTALHSDHARFTRATLDKRTKSGTNPYYWFGLQTVYLLGPEPRAALDHTTPLYTALGDTVKKRVLITSVKCCEKLLDQNSVKATDITTKTRRNIGQ